GADQPSLFGKTESFNDRRGVKVPVRNKNPFLGETSGNLAGRDIFNGKSDRRRPRFLRRGAIGPYAIDFAEAAPKSPNEALAAFLQPSDRCSQPFAPRSILRQRCQEVNSRGGAGNSFMILGPCLSPLRRLVRRRFQLWKIKRAQ